MPVIDVPMTERERMVTLEALEETIRTWANHLHRHKHGKQYIHGGKVTHDQKAAKKKVAWYDHRMAGAVKLWGALQNLTYDEAIARLEANFTLYIMDLVIKREKADERYCAKHAHRTFEPWNRQEMARNWAQASFR